MMSMEEILGELQKIARQRVIVKTSLVSEAMKAKLMADLDAKSKALESEMQPKVGGQK